MSPMCECVWAVLCYANKLRRSALLSPSEYHSVAFAISKSKRSTNAQALSLSFTSLMGITHAPDGDALHCTVYIHVYSIICMNGWPNIFTNVANISDKLKLECNVIHV